MPAGYQLVWSGQYEYMERVRERLKLVVPITLFIVFLLLYFNTGSAVKTMHHPAGGSLLRYRRSVVPVSAGLQHEHCRLGRADRVARRGRRDRGIHASLPRSRLSRGAEEGLMRVWDDLREAIVNGAVKRLRPKVMTVACMLFGLLPIMWSVGAAPMS